MGRKFSPDVVRRVVDGLVAGLNPHQAARRAGVSNTWIYRFHHRLGGVYRPAGTTYSNRYLDRDERYEIARLLESGCTKAEIARRLRRDRATIGRELQRNVDPRTGGYQPERADRLAWQRQRRPKPSKLSTQPDLVAVVQQQLDRRFSPEQIAGRLRVLFDNPQMWVSHETIYQSIYVYPRGELKKELKASLRTGRAVRRRRGRRELRSRIPDAVSIHDRPEEIEGRLIPGHHEGDLIMGSTTSNSAVGTLVERTTGYLNLLHLPNGHTSTLVCAAIIDRMSVYPDWFTRSITWDRGVEMAYHKTITAQTGIAVYFADPYSPYQRGSNENTNGLIREYLPKGSDLSQVSAEELAWIQNELNDRPRKRLGFLTPKEAYEKLLREDLQRSVATTS
jgi:IS30 family transposase